MMRPGRVGEPLQLIRELSRVVDSVPSVQGSKQALEPGIRTQVYGVGAGRAAEVAEVIADEDARSLVLRRGSEIVLKLGAVLVIARVREEAELAVIAAEVDPIATVLVRRFLVVVAVFLDTLHASDVNQPVVATEAVPGETEDEVANTGHPPNHGHADRECKQSAAVDAWSAAVVGRELVDI